MINIKDLRVGQTVCLIQRGYEYNQHNQHQEEIAQVLKVEIIKIGRRCVTVDTGITTEIYDSQKDFKIYGSHRKIKRGLYLCVQDYIDELKKEKLLMKVRDFFSCNTSQYMLLSLEELENINKIIKKYQER